MSRKKNKESLVYQVSKELIAKMSIGESKHDAKAKYSTVNGKREKIKENQTSNKIYSWETYHSYQKHCIYFANYCKEKYHCKTLDECRTYCDEWLMFRQNEEKVSAWTVKLEASALAKLYGCSTSDFVKTNSRTRNEIKRSRKEAVRDKHFSKENNKELIEFCKSTGLRRNELFSLRKNCIRRDEDGNYRIIVKSGSKGGKYRESIVIGDIQNVLKQMDICSDKKVFEKIPTNADIHGYRAEYAMSLYKMLARPENEIPKEDRYVCRKDKTGIIYDKKAMLIVSEQLGHHRISVIAGNYLNY